MYRLARAVGTRCSTPSRRPAAPPAATAGQPLCEACVAGLEATPPPLIGGVRAAFAYEEEVRQVLHHGKFRDCRSALRALAWLGAPRLAPPRGAVVVPVPLAPRRLAERGYNQAAVVATAFADFHRLAVAPLLARTRDTAAAEHAGPARPAGQRGGGVRGHRGGGALDLAGRRRAHHRGDDAGGDRAPCSRPGRGGSTSRFSPRWCSRTRSPGQPLRELIS